MSDTIRDILFVCFFVYCVATQYMLNNYEKVNDRLQKSTTGLLSICIQSNLEDLTEVYQKEKKLNEQTDF